MPPQEFDGGPQPLHRQSRIEETRLWLSQASRVLRQESGCAATVVQSIGVGQATEPAATFVLHLRIEQPGNLIVVRFDPFFGDGPVTFGGLSRKNC